MKRFFTQKLIFHHSEVDVTEAYQVILLRKDESFTDFLSEFGISDFYLFFYNFALNEFITTKKSKI